MLALGIKLRQRQSHRRNTQLLRSIVRLILSSHFNPLCSPSQSNGPPDRRSRTLWTDRSWKSGPVRRGRSRSFHLEKTRLFCWSSREQHATSLLCGTSSAICRRRWLLWAELFQESASHFDPSTYRSTHMN